MTRKRLCLWDVPRAASSEIWTNVRLTRRRHIQSFSAPLGKFPLIPCLVSVAGRQDLTSLATCKACSPREWPAVLVRQMSRAQTDKSNRTKEHDNTRRKGNPRFTISLLDGGGRRGHTRGLDQRASSALHWCRHLTQR